jgi:hypothetical protein
MNKLLAIAIVLSAGSILNSCKKESAAPIDTKDKFIDALHLKDAVLATREVKTLLSEYSETNLQALAESISSIHQVNAMMLPFNMIQTLPAQTEIKVDYTYQDSLETRFMDMYGDDNNKTILSSIHE